MSELSSNKKRLSNSVIDNWKSYLTQCSERFKELYNASVSSRSNMSLSDFEIVQTIGKGSYGTVIVAKSHFDDEYYAIKVIEKRRIVKSGQVEQTLIEKKLLYAIRFPFIVSMEYFFQDAGYLFFVMPFVLGGEMFTILRKVGKFDERKAVFYASQVVLAFEFLHNLCIVYRDLKPENLLFDYDGYIKVTDLGFAKVVPKRTYTLCGTPDYLAPEIILSRGYSHSVDWWALGVLIFEMCSGVPPFYARDVTQTYEYIVTRSFRCPRNFSESLKDILNSLLQVDTSRRLGSLKGGVDDIKSHPWFKNTDWLEMVNRKPKAPFIPKVKNKGDTCYFDEYETWVWIDHKEDLYREEFKDF